jgi:hypothetical protein
MVWCGVVSNHCTPLPLREIVRENSVKLWIIDTDTPFPENQRANAKKKVNIFITSRFFFYIDPN